MNHIIDWEYYSSLYNKVSEENFEVAVTKAEKEVRNVIGLIKWNYINEDTFGYEVLKDCIANVIEIMATNDEAGYGKGVTSVSNDGYSESYAVSSKEEVHEQLQSSIRTMLSGTGLVGAY